MKNHPPQEVFAHEFAEGEFTRTNKAGQKLTKFARDFKSFKLNPPFKYRKETYIDLLGYDGRDWQYLLTKRI